MTRDSQKFADMKKRKIIAGCCFLVVIFFITLAKGDVLFHEEADIIVEERGAEEETAVDGKTGGASGAEAADSTSEAEIKRIVVDVAGAVSRPGILIVPEGSRVYEALEAAGGVTADSDLRDINLAAELMDGEKLYVPSAAEYAAELEPGTGEGSSAQKEGSGASTGGAGWSQTDKKVNINTADLSELQRVKGVGPSTAQRILDYRKENGKFKRIEDIMNVKGIGEKTFEKMKQMISVT